MIPHNGIYNLRYHFTFCNEDDLKISTLDNDTLDLSESFEHIRKLLDL